ncbi:MAG: WD40/YVTN/BNR-like repeat-containing protein [Bryobacteraceae bacterium]
MRRLLFLLPILHAQAAIENSGAPMRVPFTCTSESMQTAGLACSEEEPCPVYLELSGIEAVGNRIFLAGNLHSATITLDSILLATEDAGKTWTEPHERLRFTALDQIQFIDFETGWISGHMVQGIPRDPFFLVTSDGGKTWRQSLVFEDGRAGVIERFRFESRTRGTMLLGTGLRKRHELYASMTGGESWTPQQVSDQPIRWPHSEDGEQQAWRIHADAKTHSFQIEKRQPERWQAVGSFLVDAARCTQ